MQNYMVKNTQPLPLHRLGAWFKKLHHFRPQAPLKRQLNADELIKRLELAINYDEEITVQMNRSFYSEAVIERTGRFFQSNDGQLFLQDRHKVMTVSPALIRNIVFN